MFCDEKDEKGRLKNIYIDLLSSDCYGRLRSRYYSFILKSLKRKFLYTVDTLLTQLSDSQFTLFCLVFVLIST